MSKINLEISAIGDDSTCTWLRLAGVSNAFPVSDPAEARETLKRQLRRIDLAVILVTPEVAEANTDLLQESLKRKDVYPIVLELPLGDTVSSGGLQALISSALGVDFEV